jgi:hypothetical protein
VEKGKMGKVSPKERNSKNNKQKRRIRSSSNKYLKPGALAQLRNSKASGTKSCTDLGKKRVAVMDADLTVISSPSIMSPVRYGVGSGVGSIDLIKLNNLQKTPKTPRAEECDSESRLESLPMDILVKIMCHLHHDQLRAVFHVSSRIRTAVTQARQYYFNYTTPDRSRQELLSTMTPLPLDHWPFARGDGRRSLIPSPHTPKAPRHAPRPPSRIKFNDMRQIAAVLFQESTFPSRYIVPSAIPKPLFKSLASNRVLFYEEELCQAVAQNKLR